MNPSLNDIVESAAWKAAMESLTRSYFDRFVATDPSDYETLLRLRDNLEALYQIDRELHDLVRNAV